MTDPTAVWYGDKLYIGGGGTSGTYKDSARLYVYTPTTDTWDTPIDTPVCWFGLTTYHSKLVLVGGREHFSEHIATNRLWTLSEHGQWQETLPPMPTKRHSACSVSYRDHLLVAGGATVDGSLNAVEVHNDNHWSSAQPLPAGYYDLKSAILDQNWYLMGGTLSENLLGIGQQDKVVHYASLDSLLASCQPSETETSQPSSVWKKLTNTPNQFSSTAVFGSRLIAVGGRLKKRKEDPKSVSSVHAYSFHTSSWIHVGDMPHEANSTCSVVLPTGELVVVGGIPGMIALLKATLKGIILFYTVKRLLCDVEDQWALR